MTDQISFHAQMPSHPSPMEDRSPADEAYLQLSIHPEERLHLIEENVRDFAIFVVAPDGQIASWNVGAQRILGYSEAEAIGMNCANIFTPEDIARGAVEHERQTAKDRGRSEDERWHRRKDGTRFWGSGIMTGLRDQQGQFRGFVKILRDMTEHKLAELQHQEDARRLAEQERQGAVLDERNRIAREIHDTLAQGLTGIAIQLEAAEDSLREVPEQAQQHIGRAKQLARECLAEARRSVRALRPQALADGDLTSALEHYIYQLVEGTTLQARFILEGASYALPAEDETDLLRIGQEALTNILKHAHASHVTLLLAFTPHQVQLSITDDGCGFDTTQINTRGFGLMGIQERVQRMNGNMQMDSAPEHGTRLIVTIPTASADSQSISVQILEPAVGLRERNAEQP